MTDQPYDTPTCACCGSELHPAHPRTACERCQERMHDRLNTVEHQWLQLPKHLERGAAIPGAGSAGRSVHPGLPLRLDVLSATGPGSDTIVGQLLAVEDDWRRARGFTVQAWRGNADQTLPKVCRFLRLNLPWACENYPDVDQLDQVLARIVGATTRVITGDRSRRVPVTCLAEYDDGTVCGQEMRVDAETLSVRCPSCGARWAREHFQRLARTGQRSAA
ncbi:hypothetical protein [Peterkaempfera griseoplana]|uniref:hypothetical protein n=1 Tax=Peterkaempfera griseoplana TaxID=66896 RepID=UPI0006E2FFE4|nr:hypothetical protein [Peterkaempfera griseoplana]